MIPDEDDSGIAYPQAVSQTGTTSNVSLRAFFEESTEADASEDADASSDEMEQSLTIPIYPDDAIPDETAKEAQPQLGTKVKPELRSHWACGQRAE